MNPSSTETWRCEYSAKTWASPEVVWGIFSDVPGWKAWNAGIEEIEMRGAFAVGSEFLMTPPGQEPLLTRLIEVRENVCFVDETRVDDLVVVVAHRLQRLASGRTRVTYEIDATGPGCSEVGPAVAADFPDVLQALVLLAESK